MESPKDFVYNSSPSGSSYYGFSPLGGNTFTNPSPSFQSFQSVNSSPGAIYYGTSSPDNPVHQRLNNRSDVPLCPVIGNSDGNPQETEDGVRCSYEYKDFQDISDLQTYADTFGQDGGFHDTMREFCSRPSEHCFGGDTPDSKTNLCTNITSVGEVGDICRTWASQNPQHAPPRSRGYESGGSWEKNSRSSYSTRRSHKSDRSNYSERYHKKNDSGISLWMIILVVILIVIIAAVFMDYRRRYNKGTSSIL